MAFATDLQCKNLGIILYLLQDVFHTLVAVSCPYGWMSPPSGNSCYFFGMGHKNSWFSAREKCLGMQGDLLKLDDQSEKDWVLEQMKQLDRTYIGAKEWWVGLNNQDDVNQWVWTDGSTSNSLLVTWGQDEPNNYRNSERCAELWKGYFNDKNCRTNLNFVCERSKDIPVTCNSDQNWEFHHGNCYKFFQKPKSWREAFSTCNREQAALTGDTTEDDHNTLQHFSRYYSVDMWIGLYSPTSPPMWVFTNGTIMGRSVLPRWMSGEPNIISGQENNTCVAVNSSVANPNNWYGDLCETENAFVCQKAEGICRPGFVLNDGLCYLFKTSRRSSWEDARDYCSNNQARLAEIKSDSEQAFVNSQLSRLQSFGVSFVWIGLSRDTSDHVWSWTNGDSLSGYANWLHIPSLEHSERSCVYILTGDINGKWMAQSDCNARKSFICVDEAITSYRLSTTITISTTIATTTLNPSTTTPTTMQSSITPRGTNTNLPEPDRTSTSRKLATTPTTTKLTTIRTTTTTRRPFIWSPQCGPFWEEDPNTHFCYQFNDKQMTWTNARDWCQRRGGDLLSISSIQEQYYIGGRTRNMISDGLWIGANTRGDNKGWTWSDGSPFAYLNFKRGEPNNYLGVEDCVTMIVRTTKWADRPCDRRYGYICKKIGNMTATVPPYVPPPVIPDGKFYGCPEQWSGYHSNCFKVVREKKTWLQARSYCRENGGDLASVSDDNEQNFLLSQLPKSHCYNMFHDDAKCDKWAKTGECTKNPVWMSTHCHLACGICIHDCKNLHNGVQCDMWANNGECHKNPKWMLQNCHLSCGVCDSAIHGGFWIGLNDRALSNSFSWTNGDRVTYTNWEKREPNNYGRRGEDCVLMKLQGGKWNDGACHIVMPGFVCKRKKGILAIPSEPPVPIGCPEGTFAYDAYCYSVNKNATQWSDAERYCAVRNGHLATVNDRYIQAYLASIVADLSSDVWIGLTDSLTPGFFEIWTSGTSLKFTHWFSQYTGNEDGTCVAMKADIPAGLWINYNCTNEKAYICELPRAGFTTTTTTAATTTTTEPLACADGWTEFNDFCYKAYKGKDNKMTWLMARETCRKLGSDLISLHSILEENFMVETFMGHWDSYWIGLNDRDIEEGYHWSDGSVVDYTNWAASEPNNYFGNEDCAEITAWAKSWNDNSCYVSKEFVCKVQKGMPVLTDNMLSTAAPGEVILDISLNAHCGSDLNWTFHQGFCYYFQSAGTDGAEPKTWFEAQQFCNDNGGHLASIHNQDTSNFILAMITKQASSTMSWIGLNELDHGGYKWSDSTPTDYLLWKPGEPNDALGGQKCVTVNIQGRWFDENCGKKLYGFICKKLNGTSNPVTTYKTPIAPGGCPPRFTGSPFNSKCYILRGFDETSDTNGPVSWFVAMKLCKDYGNGFSLLTIESDTEHAYLISLMRNYSDSFYIGLNANEDTDVYMWQDNSEVKITKWARGEPNGYDEHCVEMFGTKSHKAGDWNDVSCWNLRPYICQGYRDVRFNTPPSSEGCKAGYIKYESNCYKVNTEDKGFGDAQSLCRLDNGNLVSIHDVAEESFVAVLTADIIKPFWIGLQRETGSQQYAVWNDRWPVIYSNWDIDKDEPSKGDNEKCVVFLKGMWADTACDSLFPFVCKISLSSATPPSISARDLCPEDGYFFENYCYMLFRKPYNFASAQRTCKSSGMNLVSIHSQMELKHVMYVVHQIQGVKLPEIWIGFTKNPDYVAERVVNPGDFVWTDNTLRDFVNWADGEPSGGWDGNNEDCTVMYTHGEWNDADCFLLKSFICKKSLGSVTAASTEVTTKTETTAKSKLTHQKSSQKVRNATLSNISSFTTTPSPAVVMSPKSKPFQGKPFDTSEDKSRLRAGQIIGILIGMIGAIIILGAVAYVYRKLRPSGTYNTDQGFANALYLKTIDSDSVSISSRTKICPT